MIREYAGLWRRAFNGRTAGVRFEARCQILMTHVAAIVIAIAIDIVVTIARRGL